jgi:hypothetical protein
MRWLLLLGCGWTVVAQTPASIQILSDESQVLIGRTLQLRAVVRDAGGNRIANPTVNWSVNNSTNGSVDGNGVFRANRMAVVRVTARSGTASAETALQGIPSRVAISPERITIAVGSTQQFNAVAYDADGQPVPGVTWTWSVTNLRNGTSQTSSIASSGIMTARAEGANLVWATFTYGDVQTGLQRQWIATARVETSTPTPYTLKRLYHNLSSMRSSYPLRARPSMLWVNDEGDLFFNASLGGLAQSLLHYRNGEFKAVSTAGMPRFANGSFANEFFAHAVARKGGMVLAYEDTNINGRQLSLGDKNGVAPFFTNNTPLTETIGTANIFITRNSLTSDGQMIVRATFRFENDPVTYTGLFRAYNYRVTELLVATNEQIPALGSGSFTIDNDFGIANDGTAYYSLTLGANRAYFKHPAAGNRVKLIGINDPVAGITVRSFPGGRGNHPNFWVDENGAMLVAATLNDNNTHYLHFAPDGKLDTLRMSGLTGIFWYHPAYGALLHANPAGSRGNGMYRWKPGSEPESLFLYSAARVGGATIQDFESAAVNAAGEVFVMARTDTANFAVGKWGAEPDWYFWHDREVKVEAPLNLVTLISGARVGPPHVLAGGSTGSIAEFDASGFRPVLAIGERLYGTTMWFGGFHGGTANIRKAPNGDVYFINGAGIARIAGNGAPERVLNFPVSFNGYTINNPGNFEVNSHGDLLFASSTSLGDNRIFLRSGGEIRQLLTYSTTSTNANTIDNRVAASVDSFSLADDGRVLANLRFRNLGVPVLYLYSGNTWTRIAEPNLTILGEHRITGVVNPPRAVGDKLFALLTIQAGGNILTEIQGATPEIVVNNSTVMPNGQVTSNVSLADANRHGDVLFQQSNGGNNFLIVRPGGINDPARFRQVINLFRPTAEGDYLIRVNAIDLRDDGTVYFLAMTQDDETVLYEAKPN